MDLKIKVSTDFPENINDVENTFYCNDCGNKLQAGPHRRLFCPTCRKVEGDEWMIKMVMCCTHCKQPATIKLTKDARRVCRCENPDCGDLWSMQDLCLISLLEPTEEPDPPIKDVFDIRLDDELPIGIKKAKEAFIQKFNRSKMQALRQEINNKRSYWNQKRIDLWKEYLISQSLINLVTESMAIKKLAEDFGVKKISNSIIDHVIVFPLSCFHLEQYKRGDANARGAAFIFQTTYEDHCDFDYLWEETALFVPTYLAISQHMVFGYDGEDTYQFKDNLDYYRVWLEIIKRCVGEDYNWLIESKLPKMPQYTVQKINSLPDLPVKNLEEISKEIHERLDAWIAAFRALPIVKNINDFRSGDYNHKIMELEVATSLPSFLADTADDYVTINIELDGEIYKLCDEGECDNIYRLFEKKLFSGGLENFLEVLKQFSQAYDNAVPMPPITSSEIIEPC